jgi:branched-chain amino acid transport system substrate-binding protein
VRLLRVVAVTSLALLPLAGTGCQARDTTTGTSPVMIGADLELSGVDSAVGTTYAQALRLRIDEINARGGVDGRRLELVTRDNRSDPTLSVANLNRFTADHSVAAVVMGACSACASGVAKIIDDAKLPAVSLAPATGVATGHRYLFKLGPNAGDSAAALATGLRTAGVHRVALLRTDDVNGSDAASALTAQFSHGSTTVVTEQRFRVTDTDLTQPVHAALAHTPDALLVSAFPGQATLVAKSAREAGYSKHIFFTANAAGDLFLSGATGTATNGAVMVAPQSLVSDEIIATSPARVARRQWFDDYTARYGSFSGYSTYAADAVRLIVDAVHRAGGVSHARMRDAMEDSAFDGLSGQIRITPYNHSGVLPESLTMVVARSGRWHLLD